MRFQAFNDDTYFCLSILLHFTLERQRMDTFLKKTKRKYGEKILTPQMGATCYFFYYLA